MNKKKICLISSSGGHLEELMMLKPLNDKYNCFVVTEKTPYSKKINNMYFLHQVNRKEIFMPFWMIINTFKSLLIILKEKPDVVITTGVLSVIPFCLLMKLFQKKLIFIESFADITKPTKTGKFLYKYADRFYIQWDSMKEFYPKAICLGGIY